MTSTRRHFLALSAAGLAGVAAPLIRTAQAAEPLRIGVLLPFSGAYAQMGQAITYGMELFVRQRGGQVAGREIRFIKLDDESAPAKGPELTSKLIFGEKADILVGTVHSGVAMAMVKLAREEGIPTIIPNAGANALTRALCAPNVFRTSFSNGQIGFAVGEAMIRAGIRSAASVTWKYVAGEEIVGGFKKAFTAGGGQIVREIAVPFPDVEFQSVLAELSTLQAQSCFAFLNGGAALKFMKDYAAAGLSARLPLWGTSFLTDGIEEAAGAAGEGVRTVGHYAPTLDTPENKAFVAAYRAVHGSAPDVYGVQGWDTMQLLEAGLLAVSGDVSRRPALQAAMARAQFASPRGPFRLSSSHNPVQNFYELELRGGINHVRAISSPALADETTGCKLG